MGDVDVYAESRAYLSPWARSEAPANRYVSEWPKTNQMRSLKSNRRFFTHYWSNATWLKKRNQAGHVLDYLGGNLFRKRRVKSGDSVYVVTNLKGKLFLCAKVVVRLLRTRNEALKLREDLVESARDHLFGRQGTPMQFNSRLPNLVSRRLKFVTSDGVKHLKFISDGSLHKQTIRGVRELTQPSAVLLDRYLPSLINTASPRRTPSIGITSIPFERFMREKLIERLRHQRNRDALLRESFLRGTDAGDWGAQPFSLNRRLPGSFGSRKKK